MTPPLSPRAAAVLAYVEAHPGCGTVEVQHALGCSNNNARYALGSLYSKKLIGRQHTLFGHATSRWYPAPHRNDAAPAASDWRSDKERSMA